MLPIGGIIVGVVALLLGGYAAISLSKINKSLVSHEERVAKVEALEPMVSSAAADAAKANKGISDYARQTQEGFNTVAGELQKFREELTKMEAAATKPAAATGGKKGAAGAAGAAGSAEPAVAGPGEYVVKSGDSLAKIARSQGVSLTDLQSVNPGVNSAKLSVGQKLKLPAKKS